MYSTKGSAGVVGKRRLTLSIHHSSLQRVRPRNGSSSSTTTVWLRLVFKPVPPAHQLYAPQCKWQETYLNFRNAHSTLFLTLPVNFRKKPVLSAFCNACSVPSHCRRSVSDRQFPCSGIDTGGLGGGLTTEVAVIDLVSLIVFALPGTAGIAAGTGIFVMVSTTVVTGAAGATVGFPDGTSTTPSTCHASCATA